MTTADEWSAEALARGPVEVFVLSDAYEVMRRPEPRWGIDGRPARVGVRFPRKPGEVLLSLDGMDDPTWTRQAVARLERGEFGGITEAEAQRMRRDRAAAARLLHGRVFLAAHRFNPKLGEFVASHRPYTHYRGVLEDDPTCVLCGLGSGSRAAGSYPCEMLRSVVTYHGLAVD